MNLSDEVDLEDYVSRPDKISAAEIAAICQEAGMHAVRKNRCARLRLCLFVWAWWVVGVVWWLNCRVEGARWRRRRRAHRSPLSNATTQRNDRYVILGKDIEKGYKANVKKSDTEFAFYQ